MVWDERVVVSGRVAFLRLFGGIASVWVAVFATLIYQPTACAEAAPFSVRDSIGMTFLADPNPFMRGRTVQGVHWSPDGARFVAVTRQGDLSRNCNLFRLLMFNAHAVHEALRRKQPAASTELARFCSSTNRPGISHPKWLRDSRSVAFLGEDINQPSQVYEVDVESRTLRQLSHHATAVRDFDFNGGDRLIYAAEEPVDWTERDRSGFAVGTESLIDLAGKGEFELWTRIAFYIVDLEKGVSRKVIEEPYKVALDPEYLWLSPWGTWAVALRHVDSPPVSWWTQYVGIATNPYWQGAADVASKDFTGPNPYVFLQFTLIDMRTGASAPLLDAPCGLPFGGEGLSAIWSSDESSVILANTFLPLDAPGSGEPAAGSRSPAVVELDLNKNSLHLIANITSADHSPKGSQRRDHGVFLGISSPSETQLTLSELGAQGEVMSRTFTKTAGRWNETSRRSGKSAADSLDIRIDQDVNRPPELHAEDAAHHRGVIITDFNPQYRALDVGRVDTISWLDARGRVWTGGLLLPTHYSPGHRYPLVIQTHGYDARMFLVDGPWGSSSGFAARALANQQIMVLQIKDGVGSEGYRDELDTQMEGYSAILDKLDREGLIDRDRVGIHGWSRTGYYVQHALVFSKLKFAAASVSDASELSAYASVLFFGLYYPGMVESERMIGAPLWGDAAAQVWMERDPAFHLDRVSTPLRIEAYSQPYLGWDLYARLRRHHRPAEFVFYPNGAHSLVRPAERLRSQQGTVDWYDFWLNGKENPQTTDLEQYARWRRLKSEAGERLE